MSKLYSKKMLDTLAEREFEVAVEFMNGDIEVGIFKYQKYYHRGGYALRPLTINGGSIYFSRSQVKRIVYLANGLVYPKEENGLHKILNILDLNELVNKAGYEFI